MELMVTLDGEEPLYRQVYASLRDAILEGRLEPGQRVPATRELADRLDVSRTVILEAYRQLRMEGYLTARVGSGTYVADVLPEAMTTVRSDRAAETSASPRSGPTPGAAVRRVRRGARPLPLPEETGMEPPRFDLRVGSLRSEDFPRRRWARLLSDHVRRARPVYGPLPGHPDLRSAVAAYLRRARAVRCDAEQVVITGGAAQAFDLAARALLGPGDGAVVEEPHFSGSRYPLVAAGAELTGVPVDEEGLQVDRLPEGADQIKLAVVTPSHQFPAGGVMPLSRRAELLSWADEHDVHVLEDDYDAEFQYAVRPVESLQALDRNGRVIYVGTFSKVLSPDLRVGYVVLPPGLRDAFLELKWLAGGRIPVHLQTALAEFTESGAFDRHLRRMRNRYAGRRSALLEALDRSLGDGARVVGSNAGVHVMVRLPGLGADDVPRLLRQAGERGVSLLGVAEHYLDPPDRAEILLGYAALDEEEIGEAVGRLAEAVEAVRGETLD